VIKNGDILIVSFSDHADHPWQTCRVSSDGTITLHLGLIFQAEGKTILELRREIEDRYVPEYYSRLTLRVANANQCYTISGCAPVTWTGPISVSAAVSAAGLELPTKRVVLIRANGQRVNVDLRKASTNPRQDPEVYPGDTIHIPRRGQFW
jgi:protein involved in polysaccharide export with SLBB domain